MNEAHALYLMQQLAYELIDLGEYNGKHDFDAEINAGS